MEWVPQDMKESMISFIYSLAKELHSRHKLLHITAPAITGTEYDDQNWCGWCDYSRLVLAVDALKIMSYTESGNFSNPAPHAPDDFYLNVVNYVKNTVADKFKKRILLGANTYGHIWKSSNDAGYSTFHNCLAEAIKIGVPINPCSNSEACWSKSSNYSSYFGNSFTINRAVSYSQEFGGVGIWKADEGDAKIGFPMYPDTQLIEGTGNSDEDLMNQVNSWADSGTLSWNDYSGLVAGIYQTGNDFFEYTSGSKYIKRTNKVVEVFIRNANGSMVLDKTYYIKGANTYSGILKFNQMTSGVKANFAKLGTRALVATGIALDVAQEYFKEADRCAAEGREFDWQAKLSTVLGSAVWSGITTAGGAAIGAWAGSFIPVPVVGTLVGAGVGALVGYYGSQLTANAEAETKKMLEDMFRQTFS